MIAADVDKFYSKVIKDFITNLNKNQYLVRQLEQNNIYLNQIEHKMKQKINNSNDLFNKLTHSYNEIEKEMLLRYASSQDILFKQRQNRLKSLSIDSNLKSMSKKSAFYFSQDQFDSQSDSHILNNKVQKINNENKINYIQKNIKKINKLHDQSQNISQSQQDQNELNKNPYKKRKNSNSQNSNSFLSISQADQEYIDTLLKIRQNSKIHILGTYDQCNKRHCFKQDKTEVKLQNVFIKVEGISREIFLKQMTCISKKDNENIL